MTPLTLESICAGLKQKRNLFKLREVGSLLAPLQRGHLHMVLIKLMLHRKRPDEWPDLWCFCPLANVLAPCLVRTPCGGSKVAQAEDRKNSSTFSIQKAPLWSAAPLIDVLWNTFAPVQQLQHSQASKTPLCAPSASLFPPAESVRVAKGHAVHVSHAYFSERWQPCAASAVKKQIFPPRQFAVAASNRAAPAGSTMRIREVSECLA